MYKVKRRDPIAYELLLSGKYGQRTVNSKKQYKRKFRNEKAERNYEGQ